MDWAEIAPVFAAGGILMGNGASRAVWDPFGYGSLYEIAASSRIAHPLSQEDIEVFESLSTENFEEILFSLRQAEKICRQVGHDPEPIRVRYRNIRGALIEAVREVHPRHRQIPESVLRRIRGAISTYDHVYSTNYDLLVYWAIMIEPNVQGFTDYFWNPNLSFDLTNTEVWGRPSKVLYLHGALHIYELASGETVKATGSDHDVWSTYTPLLDIGMSYQEADTPLFVTESAWAHKLASIYRSAYLSFAYKKFADHREALTVFGQSLADQDEHLVRAISRWGDRPIAISIRPGRPEDVIVRKIQLRNRLPRGQLWFFDSTSHPLGDPLLQVSGGDD